MTIIGGIGGYLALIIAFKQLYNQKPKAKLTSALQFQDIVYRPFMISIPILITNYRNMPVSIGNITGYVEADIPNTKLNTKLTYIGSRIIADSSRIPGNTYNDSLDLQPIISLAPYGCRIAMMNFDLVIDAGLSNENVKLIKIGYRILSEDMEQELIIRPTGNNRIARENNG